MKTQKCIPVLIATILYPYIVSFSPDGTDTAWTEYRIALGSGAYTEFTRDCNGNIVSAAKIPVSDFSASVRHEEEHFRYGVHAGYLSLGSAVERNFVQHGGYVDDRTRPGREGWFLIPSAGVHWKYFGVDAGGCVTNWDKKHSTLVPSGMIRIGNREGVYLSSSLLTNMPLATGGGFFDIGLGQNFRRSGSGLWLGICIGPSMESPAISFKYDVPVSDRMFLNFRGQFAVRDLGYTDHGISIGSGIAW